MKITNSLDPAVVTRDVILALHNGLTPADNFAPDGTEGYLLVSRGTDGPPRWLSPADAAGGGFVHTLADASGLGPLHTVSGLTAGQVLRATGATSAAFAFLQASDLPAHTHPFTDITGIAARAQLPAAIAYEDEANTFSLLQTFGAQVTISPGPLVVGTDPGGSLPFRLGGSANFGANGALSFGGVQFLLQDAIYHRLIRRDGSTGIALGGAGDQANYYDNNTHWFRNAAGGFLAGLTQAAWNPATAGLLTLGTASLPWGAIHGNFSLVLNRIGGTPFIAFQRNGVAAGALESDALAQLNFYPNSVVESFRMEPTLNTSLVDFTIGSLGRFDSTDTPTDLQLLVYHAGGINKWQAESIQFVRGGGDFHAALLADNTAIAYVLLDPGVGADSPVGAPPAPAGGSFIATVGHKAFVLDIVDYVKPADFRYFEWQHCTGASCADWAVLAFTTSHTLVHSRLTTGQVKNYRARAVDRAGNVSAFVQPAEQTVVAQSDTQAFAGVIAGEIATVDLTALAGDIGILLTGQVRNAANTAGVNFGGVGGIPAGWTKGINFENTSLPSGMTGSTGVFINFDSGAHGTFIHHGKLDLNFDGTAKFRGQIDITEPLSGAASLDFILLRDPDVAHGITDFAETNVVAAMGVLSPLDGGLRVLAISEAVGDAFHLRAISNTGGSAAPIIRFSASIKNVATEQNAASDDLAFRFGTANQAQTYLDILGNGLVEIGSSAANAFMTTGLTIHQGANDNEILALKSSDVAHGMTTLAETDTFATFKKASATGGGANLTTLEATGAIGLALTSIAGSGSTTKTTAGLAPLVANSLKKSGTGTTALGANENIAVFRNAGTTRFILDGDGDSHQDVGTAWTNFDEHDDVALITQLSVQVARADDPIRGQLHVWLDENRQRLETLKLVTFNDDGHHFVNMSKLTMLLVGAVRQLAGRVVRLEEGPLRSAGTVRITG